MKVSTGITEGGAPPWPAVGDLVRVQGVVFFGEVGSVADVDHDRQCALVAVTKRNVRTGKSFVDKRWVGFPALSPWPVS